MGKKTMKNESKLNETAESEVEKCSSSVIVVMYFYKDTNTYARCCGGGEELTLACKVCTHENAFFFFLFSVSLCSSTLTHTHDSMGRFLPFRELVRVTQERASRI